MATEGFRWVPDNEGQARIVQLLGQGLDGFAASVVERIKPLAPFGTGVHLPRLKKRPILRYHYRNTIRHSTWVNGVLISGAPVGGRGFNPDKALLQSIIYTTAAPLGHIFEITGARRHDIPIPLAIGPYGTEIMVNIPHPGVARKPHFVPGLFSAVGDAGATIRGRILAKAL